MDYANCKVYNDGSHYIAIPYKPNPHARRGTKIEETIDVPLPADTTLVTVELPKEREVKAIQDVEIETDEIVESVENDSSNAQFEPFKCIKMTKRDLFEEIYAEIKSLKKKDLRFVLVDKMQAYFDCREDCEQYVEVQLDRKRRNTVCRRARLWRKVNLQDFNYFCTFTYDDKKHDEASFQKMLKDCFKKMCYRRGWKYVGVWERSPEKHRLHFHGLFHIPEGSLPGEMVKVSDYSPFKKTVQHTLQNTHFNDRFGRSDFKEIDKRMLGDAVPVPLSIIRILLDSTSMITSIRISSGERSPSLTAVSNASTLFCMYSL